jgi:hypothetical protein
MGADLGRLLEAEQVFAARIDAARREARALVEIARGDAQALSGDSAEELARSRARLGDEEERALRTELSRFEAEISTRIERLRAVDESRVNALADQLLRALLSGGRR